MIDTISDNFVLPSSPTQWADLVLLSLFALIFFWKAQIMFRRTVEWDNLGRSLAYFALVCGALFSYAAVATIFPTLVIEYGWIRNVIRASGIGVGLFMIWALLTYDWPPPPDRPPFTRFPWAKRFTHG